MRTTNLPDGLDYAGNQQLWLSGFLAGFNAGSTTDGAVAADRDAVLAAARAALAELDNGVSAPEMPVTEEIADRPTTPKRSPWTRKNPYAATLVANRPLRGSGSAKDVRHVVFDLGDSNIDYEAGDSLGIRPVNDPHLVSALITRIGADPHQAITTRAGEFTLVDALTHEY
jgi:sulfite reductase (NADPH) flavoprotein alpha-component